MGLWAATGTAKSLGYGLDVLPAILLGVASAVGGGVIRDVLVEKVPVGGGPLYATGALVTAVFTCLVVALGLPSPLVLIAVAVGSLLAGVAAWRRWTLPAHSEWQVTMSAAQLKSLVRRTRKDERERVALETGAIPVVDGSSGARPRRRRQRGGPRRRRMRTGSSTRRIPQSFRHCRARGSRGSRGPGPLTRGRRRGDSSICATSSAAS